MHEALPALVLDSKALSRTVMNETPTNQASSVGHSGAAPSTSDEQLTLAFSKGSSHAFEELFSLQTADFWFLSTARLRVRSGGGVDAGDFFLAVLRAGARHEPRALFRTYLYAIGFKILRAHRRKAALRATFFGQQNSAPDPSRCDATESGLWVRRAVGKLEAIDREILLLREFEQLSYAEIANLLELPLNTVRSRLFRARTALRNLLEPSAEPATNHAEQPISKKGERS